MLQNDLYCWYDHVTCLHMCITWLSRCVAGWQHEEELEIKRKAEEEERKKKEAERRLRIERGLQTESDDEEEEGKKLSGSTKMANRKLARGEIFFSLHYFFSVFYETNIYLINNINNV